MISHLFRRNRQHDIIASLYGAIVAQARAPAFYRDLGVPDTVNGRFEMLVLHMALFLIRLEGESAATRELGQGVFDLFCRDMDANMREMGVGDISVARKMRAVGEAFYGRKHSYEAALAGAHPGPLCAALARNVYAARSEGGPGVGALASYVRRAAGHLAAQDAAALRRGELAFPPPDGAGAPLADAEDG